MKRATRVWIAMGAIGLLVQCGVGVPRAISIWRMERSEAEWEARAAVPPAPPSVAMPVIPPPPIVPPSVAVGTPVPTPPAPSSALHEGPLTLATMSREDLVARMGTAGLTVTVSDPPTEAGMIAEIWANASHGNVRVLLVDCARAGTAACSADANRVILGQTGNADAAVQPLLTPDVETSSDLQRALRAAHLRGVGSDPMLNASGMRWDSVHAYGDTNVYVYVRNIRDVPRRHGAVLAEGNAVLWILVDEYDGAESLMQALVGHPIS